MRQIAERAWLVVSGLALLTACATQPPPPGVRDVQQRIMQNMLHPPYARTMPPPTVRH